MQTRHFIGFCLIFSLGLCRIASAASHEAAYPALSLLDAPINATWAANTAEDWKDQGFRGFLFQGILDDLRLFPSEEERLQELRKERDSFPWSGDEGNTTVLKAKPRLDAAPMATMEQIVPAHWDALGREIRSACNRLKAAGLDRNFVRVSLAPDNLWFTDPALLSIAERRFQMLGEFCQRVGLRGIALDIQSGSLIYDYRWDGYKAETTPETLAHSAYTFGLRVLRAFISACPSGEILLLMEELGGARPLSYDFMEGALASPGAADTIRISVASIASAPLQPQSYYRHYPHKASRFLSRRASHGEKGGALSASQVLFAFEPIYYEGDIPTARYALDDYLTALHRAAFHGGAYMLIRAPEGGWWHTPPDLVDQYEDLQQRGAARVRFYPPVPRSVDAYAPRLVFAEAVKIGNLRLADAEAAVLKGESGASVMLWSGLDKELRLSERSSVVTAMQPITGEERHFMPRDGSITIPPLSGPVLLEGLPLRAYALPAAMHLVLRQPISGGVSHTELTATLMNPLAAAMRGSLTLASSAQYALGQSTFLVNLAPGADEHFRRTLRGISRFGSRPEFRISLSIAADPVLTRDFPFYVAPEEAYTQWGDAPLLAAPAVLPDAGQDAHDDALLFICDGRGKLMCLDALTGACLWYRRLTGSFSQDPVLIKDSSGSSSVAVVSDQGRLRLYDPQGKEKLLLWSEEQSIRVVKTRYGTAEEGGDRLLVIDKSNRLFVYDVHGRRVHDLQLPAQLVYALTAPAFPERVFLVLDAGSADMPPNKQKCFILCALDRGGEMRWEMKVDRGVSCAPVLLGGSGDDVPRLFTALEDGSVLCLDPDAGTRIATLALADAPLRCMAATSGTAEKSPWLYGSTDAGLYAQPLESAAYTDALPPPWQIPGAGITALTALPDGEGVLIGMADGDMYTLSEDASLLWEDHEGFGAVLHMPVLPDGPGTKAYHYVTAYSSGALRCLKVRRDLLSPAPALLDALSPP
ncbi:MAG: PQQ-binding-like beta-propeller repeat protein [Candidatus Hydrogenedentales bacterium]